MAVVFPYIQIGYVVVLANSHFRFCACVPIFSMCMVVQLSYSDLQCILCWQVSNAFQDLKAALVGFQHEDRSIGFGTQR